MTQRLPRKRRGDETDDDRRHALSTVSSWSGGSVCVKQQSKGWNNKKNKTFWSIGDKPWIIQAQYYTWKRELVLRQWHRIRKQRISSMFIRKQDFFRNMKQNKISSSSIGWEIWVKFFCMASSKKTKPNAIQRILYGSSTYVVFLASREPSLFENQIKSNHHQIKTPPAAVALWPWCYMT